MQPIKNFFQTLIIRFSIIGELFSFLWNHKLWWIMPIILITLIGIVIIIFGQTTGIAPFLYPLF